MTNVTRIYIWRDRTRGFLTVTAKSLDEARDVVAEKAPAWERYARTHEPHTTGLARSGEAIAVAQR